MVLASPLGPVYTRSTFRLSDAERVHGLKCARSCGTIYDERGPILVETADPGGPFIL